MSDVTDSMSNGHGTLAKSSENQSSLPDSEFYTVNQGSA